MLNGGESVVRNSLRGNQRRNHKLPANSLAEHTHMSSSVFVPGEKEKVCNLISPHTSRMPAEASKAAFFFFFLNKNKMKQKTKTKKKKSQKVQFRSLRSFHSQFTFSTPRTPSAKQTARASFSWLKQQANSRCEPHWVQKEPGQWGDTLLEPCQDFCCNPGQDIWAASPCHLALPKVSSKDLQRDMRPEVTLIRATRGSLAAQMWRSRQRQSEPDLIGPYRCPHNT